MTLLPTPSPFFLSTGRADNSSSDGGGGNDDINKVGGCNDEGGGSGSGSAVVVVAVLSVVVVVVHSPASGRFIIWFRILRLTWNLRIHFSKNVN
jgi:hypothetical protein